MTQIAPLRNFSSMRFVVSYVRRAGRKTGALSMTRHTERRFYATASWILGAILFSGFIVAYGAAAAGALGLVSAWRVSFLTLLGGSISFFGMVGYFLVSGAALKSRLAGFNNLNDPASSKK
jgi:hypothetical protein